MNRESIQKLHNIHQAAASAIRDNDIELVKYISAVVNDILREEAVAEASMDITSDEVQMLKDGYVINAIKAVRARKSSIASNGYFGLKEAKDLVEAAGDRLGLRVDGQWHKFKSPW